MAPTTTSVMIRIARIITAVAGVLASVLGLFLVWFAVEWADAWGGKADLAPGLGFIALGVGVFVLRLFLPRRPAVESRRN